MDKRGGCIARVQLLRSSPLCDPVRPVGWATFICPSASAAGQRYGAFFALHDYEAYWSNPMPSVARSNAIDWSGGVQADGQVECNFALREDLHLRLFQPHSAARTFGEECTDAYIAVGVSVEKAELSRYFLPP